MMLVSLLIKKKRIGKASEWVRWFSILRYHIGYIIVVSHYLKIFTLI